MRWIWLADFQSAWAVSLVFQCQGRADGSVADPPFIPLSARRDSLEVGKAGRMAYNEEAVLLDSMYDTHPILSVNQRVLKPRSRLIKEIADAFSTISNRTDQA
jgi:hypothetical protein